MSNTRRDLSIVLAIPALAAVLAVHYDVSESIAAWARPHEALQVDELPGVLLVLAVCLAWFAWRRYTEARAQLSLRRVAERSLAIALEDNRSLAQRYLDLHEQERRALARDLHDELGQYVNVIKLDAVALRAFSEDLAVQSVATAMVGNIDRIYGSLSGLIRQLRPVGLDELGLAAALEHCVGEWRTRLPATHIDLAIDGDMQSLDEARAITVYRLVQEALTNVARHAAARHVTIRVTHAAADRAMAIAIRDDGQGAAVTPQRAGLGLIGMRERVAALGGTIAVASDASGFFILASLPETGAA